MSQVQFGKESTLCHYGLLQALAAERKLRPLKAHTLTDVLCPPPCVRFIARYNKAKQLPMSPP
eukprot:3498315-Amphidinium_carterae.1